MLDVLLKRHPQRTQNSFLKLFLNMIRMNTLPYEINITFNKKRYTIAIHMNREVDGKMQCDFEIYTTEKMSGNEFQRLRAYLEKEGYVDAAKEHYGLNS
jgi:hypothetical protein